MLHRHVFPRIALDSFELRVTRKYLAHMGLFDLDVLFNVLRINSRLCNRMWSFWIPVVSNLPKRVFIMVRYWICISNYNYRNYHCTFVEYTCLAHTSLVFICYNSAINMYVAHNFYSTTGIRVRSLRRRGCDLGIGSTF